MAEFKTRIGKKISDTVWELAEKPSAAQIAVLVESLQTPSDAALLRRTVNVAEKVILCDDHSRVDGCTPDTLAKPCGMFRLRAISAIDKEILARLDEDEGGRKKQKCVCVLTCVCNQTSGRYFTRAGIHAKHP